MRRELYYAGSALLLLFLACDSPASTPQARAFSLWSVAVRTCIETSIAPDGLCTPGQNGDLPLSTAVALKDAFGVEYASSATDSQTGATTLSGHLPEGYSPHIGYRDPF
jgi:hypothetical protein